MDKKEIQLKKPEDMIQVSAFMVYLLPELQKGQIFDCTIEQHREKRSKNANDYSWVLQDKIAKTLNESIDNIHNKMVLEYGVMETYSILKEAFDSAKRLFDYYEIIGNSTAKGKDFIHVRVGIGTHNYNTKEMATFIDGIIQEAQNLGIETKTPDEIAKLKSLWRANEKHNAK